MSDLQDLLDKPTLLTPDEQRAVVAWLGCGDVPVLLNVSDGRRRNSWQEWRGADSGPLPSESVLLHAALLSLAEREWLVGLDNDEGQWHAWVAGEGGVGPTPLAALAECLRHAAREGAFD